MEFTQRVKARLKQVHDWNQIPEELVAEIEKLADASEKSKAHCELAKGCEVYLQDRAHAMESYQAAFKLDRQNISALEGARRIYHEMGQLEMEQGLLKLQQRFNPSPSTQAELGRVLLDLRQTDEAMAMIREAHEQDSNDSRAADLFEQINYDRGQWEEAFASINEKIKELCGVDDPAAAETKDKGREVSRLYLRAARIMQQESPDNELIPPYLFKSLDADPLCNDAGYLAELQLTERGHLPFVQRLQDRRAEAVNDPERRAELFRQFASVWLVRYNNPETSAYFARKALELFYSPSEFAVPTDHIASFRLLAANADAAGGPEALVPLAKRGLDKLEGHEDRGLLALEAAALAHRMGADEAVVDALMKLVDVTEHPEYIAWQKTRADGVSAAEDPASNGAVVDTGELQKRPEAGAKADKKDKPAGVDFDRSKLEDEEYSEEELEILARAEKSARKGGRRAIDAWRDAVSKLPDKQYPRKQLREIYESGGKWSNVADLIKEQIKRAPEHEHAALHWELVEIYRDRLKQHSMVIHHLEAIDSIYAETGDTSERLRVIEAQQTQYTKMKRWSDVIGRLRKRAELTEDAEHRVELLLESGNLYLDKYSNQPEAIKCFEEVLEDDPSNAQAIEKLKELYQRRRDWEKLVELQQRELDGIEDPELRKSRLLEIARTAASKVKNSALSQKVWSAVLECDPTHVEALEQLEALQERERNWESLAQTLRTLTEVESDPKKRATHLAKLGAIYSDKLNENGSAIQVWEELLEIDPNHRRAQDALRKLYIELGDLEALERFYERQDNWSEFVRVLERELDNYEGSEKTALMLKISGLYTERLNRPDRAVRVLERGMNQDEPSPVLADALIELYQASGDERRLVSPLRVKLASTDEAGERYELQKRIANISEHAVKDYASAFSALQDAYREDHQRQELVPELVRLGQATNAHQELVQSLQHGAFQWGDDREGIVPRLAAAETYETFIEDAESALEAYQGVLAIEAEHPQALEALERLYLKLGREQDLLSVLQTRLDGSDDEDQRVELLRRMGAIHHKVGAHDAAVEALGQVVALDRADREVLQRLDSIYSETQRWEELASVLEKQLEIDGGGDEHQRSEFSFRLGQTLHRKLNRGPEAVSFYEQVLLDRPEHEGARDGLQALLDDPDSQQNASRVLLPLYETAQDWASVVRCLQIELQQEAEGSERSAELLRRIASIYGAELNDPQHAFENYAQALRDNGEDEFSRGELRELASAQGWWQRYAQLLEEVSSKTTGARRRAMLGELAEVYELQLDSVSGAIRAHRERLNDDEGDLESLQALEKLLQRSEKWEDLLEVYEKQLASVEDDGQRAEIRLKIARLQDETLEQNDQAIESYQQLMDDPDYAPLAQTALDRLYTKNERWSELGDILSQQIRPQDPEPENVARMLRLGELRAQKLEQRHEAIELYGDVLDIDAHNQSAISALEGMLDAPDDQLQVARKLEPIYRSSAQWEPLIKVMDIMVDQSHDDEQKRDLLLQIADIQSTTDQSEQAFEATGKAFLLRPDDAPVQAKLSDLAQRLDADEKLVALYSQATDDSEDDNLKVELLRKVGEIYDQRLGDSEKAAETYDRILEIHPDDLQAVDELIGVHHRASRFEELSRAVQQKVEVVEDPQAKRDLLLYAAMIHKTQLAQPERAEDLYQQVLEVDHANAEALDNLETLHVAGKNWDAFKDVLHRRMELADEPNQQREVLRRLAQLYDEQLGDSEQAIDTYQRLITVAPDDHMAISALDRLYGEANRPHEQLQILERAIDQGSDRELEMSLRYRIGQLLQNDIDDRERAVQAYRDLLDRAPEHAEAMSALGEMVHDQGDPTAAAEVLEPRYEARGDWDKLVGLHSRLADYTDSPDEQISRLHRAADLRYRQLQDIPGTFALYEKALDAQPEENETVARMEELSQETGQWQRFVDGMAKRVQATDHTETKTRTLLRMAEVQRQELDDVDGAIARYREVLDIDPTQRSATDSLDRVYQEQGRWPELVENLKQQLPSSEGERWLDQQFRIAEIYRNQLQDYPNAIAAYREILLSDPDHVPTIAALEALFEAEVAQLEVADILQPIYESSQDWEKVVQVGRVRFSASEDVHDRFAIIQKVADICENKLGATDSALHWWLRAYAEDPSNDEALMQVERLGEMTGQWHEVANTAAEILEGEQANEPERRIEVLCLLGSVLDQHLAEPEAAMESYQEVLTLDEDNAKALEALSRIYGERGMYEELAEVSKRCIKNELNGEKLVELELGLARLYEQHLGQDQEAIAAYQRVLDHNSGNEVALDALERVYLSQEKWSKLYEVYERKAEVSENEEEIARCYQHMAKLCSGVLDRRDDAIEHWTRVLERRGDEPIALAELAELCQDTERWEQALDALKRYTYVQEDDELKMVAYQDLGRIHSEHLDQPQAALEAWTAAQELAPHDPLTLKTLRSMYESMEKWPELADVLRALSEVSEEELAPDSRRDLLARLGVVQGEYLMDNEPAIEAWNYVLDYDQGDREALDALERIYHSEARWEEAVDVLRRRADHSDDDEEARVDALRKIALLWDERLDNRDEAILAYEDLLTVEPADEATGARLEEIYREEQRWEELRGLLIRRAENASTAEDQVVYLQQAAKIDEEHQGDLESAFAILKVALQCDFTNEQTAAELERIATQTDRWDELLEEYEEQVEQIENPEERCNLLVKMARWYLERGDARSIDYLEQAIKIDESNLSVQRERAHFYRTLGETDELANSLRSLVDIEHESDRKVKTLLELAEVERKDRQDGEAAATAYRAVLDLDGEHPEALSSLAQICEEKGHWEELVQIWTRVAAQKEEPLQRLSVYHRIAQVQEEHLGDAAGAMGTYQDIVAADAGDREALVALERLYLESGQIDDYLDTLEAELDATYDPDEQVQVYEKMANALIEHADDSLRAAEALENIIIKDPSRDDVYRKLESLYSNMERWPEVVETYRSHVESSDDRDTKVELLFAMGEIFEKQLEDPDRAKDCYSEILELDPANLEAVKKRTQLQEVVEDWRGAVDSLRSLAKISQDPSERVELYTRSGHILVSHLQDYAEAEETLEEALAIDPGHVPAMRELAEVYRQRGDWEKAAHSLRTGANAAQASLRGQLAADAGYIYLEELDDKDSAVEMFSQVLAADPEQARVGLTLASIYFEQRDFEKAAPIYQMLSSRIHSLELDNFQKREVLYRAAIVAREQNDQERALEYFEAAYDVDSTDREVLVGMAELCYDQNDWDRAFKLYQAILVQHRDMQSDEETVKIYYRLGTIRQRQGESRKALNYLEKALEVQPNHRPTLDAMIQYQSENGDWDGVIAAKQALCEVASNEDERFALYREVGDIYANRLGNRRKAIEAYEIALEAQPQDFGTLHVLLDLHTGAEQWADAVEIIDRIVAVEQDGQRRSHYNYTAAVLVRDHMQALDDSVNRFNKVLDDDPSRLKAFQAIDTILTKGKNWKELERNYRRMLKRLPADDSSGLRLALLDNLGEIYRSRLQQFPEAIETYSLAKKLDPNNVKRRLILGELYQHVMSQRPEEYVNGAVQELQELLYFEPHRYETYRALFEVYRDSNQIDKAFCVASAMMWIGRMTKRPMAEEEQFYQRYRPRGIPRARTRLSEEVLRRHVFHPQQDHLLTAIMGIMAKPLAVTRAQESNPLLDQGNRIDISTNPSPVAQTAKYIRDVLNVQTPELIVRADSPGDMMLLNLRRDDAPTPTLVIMHDMAKRMSDDKAAAFLLGRHLSELYFPHYAYVTLDRSHRNVKDVFFAARRLCGLPVPGDERQFEALAKRYRPYLAAGEIDGLRDVMRAMEEQGGATDVKTWGGATELTCYRIGLLMCGDLESALHMVSVEAQNPTSPFTATDKAKELLLYSVSEGHFAARQALGVQVG